jgi:hypothetical protein
MSKPSLQHVSMWNGHGWEQTTITEAVQKCPYGASEKSGLFVCDLCGQFVILTRENVRKPYFKHSSKEKSKNCPDRTFNHGANYYHLDDRKHDLPIKLKILSKSHFMLYLGFFKVPSSVIGEKKNQQICIRGKGRPFCYSLDKININSITYFQIGDDPSKSYKIDYPADLTAIKKYWPTKIQGISEDGSFFDKRTGKKLPEDADVTVGQTCYLLTKKDWIRGNGSIQCKKVCQQNIDSYVKWNIYEIAATKYDYDSARFFLYFHARLTDRPVTFFPIWPQFIENPYRVLYCSHKIYFYFEGEDIKSRIFPSALIQTQEIKHSSAFIRSIQGSEKHQIVVAGRMKVLKYTYLWKDKLDFPLKEKKLFSVRDCDQQEIAPGTYKSFPKEGKLFIKSKVDGFAEITDNEGFPLMKVELPAGKLVPIKIIRSRCVFHIYCGLDLVWSAEYQGKQNRIVKYKNRDDIFLVKKLNAYHRDYILVSHAVGSIAAKLNHRPALKQWVSKQIRNGRISRRALNTLRQEIRRDHE